MDKDDAGTPAAAGGFAGLAQEMAAKSALVRKDNGHIDLLAAAGGVRGIAESVLPGLVFLVIFTVSRNLNWSLLASVAVALVFLVMRLVQRTPLTQALAGIAGVALSAVLAMTTGKAENYYLVGFLTNAGYIAAMVVSIAVRWPVLGLLFGYARNEGVRWRAKPERLRAYRVATWIIVAVMAARLAVQLPLYFTNNVDALGAMRLIMGVPLYALGLWVAWLLSRPVATEG
ncbi:potassium ABC transporter [Arthrobacter sp. ERGS1:01]|uniref:DUF3159 domain-containing protein n=1 Tax=Arthrobacter sp. ERGS1:01 TaxID=1704044 RepID=UPI0006B5E105|nr:DUF3159 domain-containing protein [Arthrobacter sp. ERGS1:01]ALE07686.1 potassium ABC transporter [Arthrobacter sp. ERGS1:01]